MSPMWISFVAEAEEAPADPTERLGFVEALKGREDEFPLLARAAQDLLPVGSGKIEWPVPVSERHCLIGWNYLQIVRLDDFGRTKGDALTLFLQVANELLRHGKRGQLPSAKPRRQMGGVRELLGRDEEPGDQLKLAVLRDLVYLPDRQPLDSDDAYGEWLAEFSLVAIPGR